MGNHLLAQSQLLCQPWQPRLQCLERFLLALVGRLIRLGLLPLSSFLPLTHSLPTFLVTSFPFGHSYLSQTCILFVSLSLPSFFHLRSSLFVLSILLFSSFTYFRSFLFVFFIRSFSFVLSNLLFLICSF